MLNKYEFMTLHGVQMKLRQFLFEATVLDFKRQLREDRTLNESLVDYLFRTESKMRRRQPFDAPAKEMLVNVLTSLQLLDHLDELALTATSTHDIFTFINSLKRHNQPISCMFEAFSSLTRCAPQIAAQMQVKVNESGPIAVMLNHAWHNYQCSKVACEPSFSD